MNIVNNINSYIPREVSMTTFGVTLAAASGVALQIITSSSQIYESDVVLNFLAYSGCAGGIIGIVMTVYSMVRSCQKIISAGDELSRSATITFLGGLSSALIQTIGKYFWTIAPSFRWLHGHTIGYALVTNFAWQAALVAGVGALAVTAYAAYRLGVAAIN